jgi:RNA polymerase sigma-70 factor, ECF subfamily
MLATRSDHLLVFGAGVRDTTRSVTERAGRVVARDNTSLDAAMDRYARGEDGAFGEVYDTLAPRLYGFLLRYTRDHAKAEDVVQQTMLQIHRARGRFLPGAEVTPWAFAIARRLLIDQHRRGGREILAATDDAVGELLVSLDAGADDVAIAKEVAERLGQELERLPENQRAAFELIKQEGLSVAEAAQVLGTTVAAVKLRAHRAYEALRAALAIASKKPSRARGREPSGGRA